MRALGYSVSTTVVIIANTCGLRILWIYTCFASHRSLGVLFAAWPLTWIVCDVLLLALFLFGYYRKIVKPQKRAKTEPAAGKTTPQDESSTS